MRKTLSAIMSVVALSITIGPGAATASHNADRIWLYAPANGYDHYIRWDTDSTIGDSGAFFNAIANGAGSWNVVGTELLFAKATSSIRMDISKGSLGYPYQNSAAATYLSEVGGSLANGWIRFDSTPPAAGGCGAPTWYTGTSTSVPDCQLDVRTYAVHEWGHAVSLRHVTTATYQSDVMYQYSPIGATKRTLTTHDKSGIQALY